MKLTKVQGEYISKVQTDQKKDIYRFIVSDERINRNGWKTITAGIDYKSYLDNPIILWGHESWSLPIGTAVNVFTEDDKLYADIWFHESDDYSKTIKKLVDQGVLKMTSIGISVSKKGDPIPIPQEEKDKYPSWLDVIEVFTQSELREISIVPIPANGGARFVEKLDSAIKSGLFTASELKIMPSIINIDNENNHLSTIEGSARMTLDEALKETGRLTTELQAAQSEKNTMADKLKAATDKEAESAQKLTEATQKIADAEAKITQLEKEAGELKTEMSKLNDKTIEAEVDAALADLKDKILPAENNAENNFKLKRELIHLKKNSDNMKDADGKSYYEIKVAELKGRTSLDHLRQNLGANDKPLPAIKKEDIDLKNQDHREWLAKEATRLAKENGTNFTLEYNKLIGDL